MAGLGFGLLATVFTGALLRQLLDLEPSSVSLLEECQHLSFVDYVVDVLHLCHTLLPEGLERTDSVLFLVECLVDLSKVANTYALLDLKVSNFWLYLLQTWAETLFSGSCWTTH